MAQQLEKKSLPYWTLKISAPKLLSVYVLNERTIAILVPDASTYKSSKLTEMLPTKWLSTMCVVGFPCSQQFSISDEFLLSNAIQPLDCANNQTTRNIASWWIFCSQLWTLVTDSISWHLSIWGPQATGNGWKSVGSKYMFEVRLKIKYFWWYIFILALYYLWLLTFLPLERYSLIDTATTCLPWSRV